MQQTFASKQPRDATAEGKVEDDRGRPLTSSHATKAGRRYRYYISRPDQDVDDGWRIPAKTLEAAVTDTIVAHLTIALRWRGRLNRTR